MKKKLLLATLFTAIISSPTFANKLNLSPSAQVNLSSTYLSKNVHSTTGSYSVGVKKKYAKGAVTVSRGRTSTHLFGQKTTTAIAVKVKRVKVKHTRGKHYRSTKVKAGRVAITSTSSSGKFKVAGFKIPTRVKTTKITYDIHQGKHVSVNAGVSRVSVSTPFGGKSGNAPTIGVSVKF